MSERTCLIEGCANKVLARDRCGAHYYHWKKTNSQACNIDDCEKPAYGHGMCNMHWRRWWKNGDPRKGGRKSAEERFLSRVRNEGDCLVWTGTLINGKYGQMRLDGKRVYVHRYAWERVNGPIPAGMQVDHICWNTACVNVEHLRVVTPSENCAYLSGTPSNNKSSGHRNIIKSDGLYRVVATKNNKRFEFGGYRTIEEAIPVAEQARLELFGEFAGRG